MLILQLLLAAAALLLIVAGVTKLRAPGPALRAARAMGLPATTSAIRLLAAAEVAVGAAAILTPWTVVRLALALLYSAFLVFVVAAIARNAPISSCGCFGANDVPPSLVHVAINACAAAVGSVAAADDVEAPLDAITSSAGDAVVIVVGAAVIGAASGLALSGRLVPQPDR